MSNIRKIGTASATTALCFLIVLNAFGPENVALAQTDTTPPATNCSISGTMGLNDWYTSNATVNLTATDASGVANITYDLDNNGWTAYAGNLTIADGVHLLQYNSTDNAGNMENNSSNKAFIRVDTAPPRTTPSVNGNKSSDDWYLGPVTVSLTAIDDASKVAGTWYNMNCTGWKPYNDSGIVLADGTYAISYYSADNAGNIEAPQNVTINVNAGTDKPVTTLSEYGTLGTNWWYLSNAMIVLNATGGTGGINHTEYNLNGQGWVTGNTLTVSSEGWNKLLYRSVDNAGNVEDNNTIWIPVDKSGPVVGLSISGDWDYHGWYNGDITITLSVSDNGSGVNLAQYGWDDVNWYAYTGPFKVGWTTSRVLYYRATDNQSHVTEGSHFIYFRPVSLDQGPMSDKIYSGVSTPTPTPTATPTPTPTATPTPTPTATPTPTSVPSATAQPQNSNSGLALGILVVLLVVIAIGCAALYFFTLKPK